MVRKKSKIVVGLGYGDEGKGLTTDYICSISKSPIVIRFNGGHQAGHCVVLNSGLKHIFSNFGAGTLRNVPTYWSQYCTFEPLGFLNELISLKKHKPHIFIDLDCEITTHYDILYNRALETTLHNNRRGSCGKGFGATIDRSQIDNLSFRFKDFLDYNTCINKLNEIRNYYKPKFNIETFFDFNDFAHDETDILFLNLINKIKMLIYEGIVIPVKEKDIFSNDSVWQTYVFEGAQGILLDQNYGIKPHITKSNTTSRNALDILKRNNFCFDDIEIYYVTRSYQTRHGAGPFNDLSNIIKLKNNELETNQINQYQGVFKVNYLDVDKLNYALKCDLTFSENIKKILVTTCLDQIKDIRSIPYYSNKKLRCVDFEEINKLLCIKFDSLLFGFGNCSEKLTPKVTVDSKHKSRQPESLLQ